MPPKLTPDADIRAILDANLAAHAEVDETLLDAPTYTGYTETLRQDITTLTGDDKTVAPMKVAIVAIAAKLWKPEWDTRKHQTGLGGLRSLRTVDHNIVADHLHKLGLYRTGTEGALTRTFEQKSPYTMTYPGEIKPIPMRWAFLRILSRLNESYSQPLAETMLRTFLTQLKSRQTTVTGLQTQTVSIAESVSIQVIATLLNGIFDLGSGVSVTPAIVVHTAFTVGGRILWPSIQMVPLKHHTASDSTSKAFGDVEGTRDGVPALSVEIKHNLSITEGITRTFSQKTSSIPFRYILTTKKTATSYTEDDILIGNVTEIVTQLLHSCRVQSPAIAATFARELRAALMGNVDLGSSNKSKIDTLFNSIAPVPPATAPVLTEPSAAPSPEAPPRQL
jgi:hypothetical protein